MDSKKTQNNSKNKDMVEKERRSFLKKAVYTAPSLLVLGSLARPTASKAGESQITDGPDDGWTTQ